MMNTYHIEHAPTHTGFAFGGEVREVESFVAAIEGAKECAAKNGCETTFWAVERESAIAGSPRGPIARSAYGFCRSLNGEIREVIFEFDSRIVRAITKEARNG